MRPESVMAFVDREQSSLARLIFRVTSFILQPFISTSVTAVPAACPERHRLMHR
ncbi:hypothetical protein C7S13_5089 [Burkholderia cepacia]|nr:hypothetical protein [Burkholderia cepacia]